MIPTNSIVSLSSMIPTSGSWQTCTSILKKIHLFCRSVLFPPAQIWIFKIPDSWWNDLKAPEGSPEPLFHIVNFRRLWRSLFPWTFPGRPNPPEGWAGTPLVYWCLSQISLAAHSTNFWLRQNGWRWMSASSAICYQGRVPWYCDCHGDLCR